MEQICFSINEIHFFIDLLSIFCFLLYLIKEGQCDKDKQ